MNFNRCPFGGLTAALALCGAAAGAEIIVPDDLPLGAAISLAADGDTITIMPGVYDGSQGFLIEDKTLLIRSFSGDPTDTIIDGFNVGRILEITGAGASGTTLEGLTLRNGDVTVAGGNAIGGAGVSIDGCDVTIANCVFEGNNATNSGGQIRAGAVYAGDASLTVLGSVFLDNMTTTAGSDGGAIVCDGPGTHLFEDCLFESNSAVNTAGAVRVDTGTAQFTNCVFQSNDVGGDPDVRGGAIFARVGAVLTLDACTFRDNTSTLEGGALATLDVATSVTVRNSVFQNNSSATNGGAITNQGTISIVNSTFEGNASAICAVLCGSNSSVASIANAVLWNNQPNADQLFGGSLSVQYSIVQGGFPGVGNLDVDPMFVAAGEGDLSLQAGSPAIDAGSSSLYAGPFVDLAGNDRAVDDPDAPDAGEAVAGPVIDMGAYEFPIDAVPSCPGDLNGDGSVGTPDLIQMLGAWGACP